MRGLLLLITGFAPACTSGLYETQVEEQGACTALEGRTFTSSDGGQLAFDVDSAATSQVTWFDSEIAEAGQVSCVGTKVTATIAGRTLRAVFDPQALRLQWAGVSYAAP